MITLEMMPPMMFGGLVLAMLIGFPVAFTLAAVGLSFGFLAIHLGFFDMNFLQAIPGRVFGSVLSNELLLAIPFFTFMGAILERCGLAEDMLDSMGQLFGPIRGGLGYSVILVGFILGAITGTVAAQVIAMALISMPIMIRYGYNIRYITGVLAASGTITQLVPPSLVLIVLADQLGKSVGDMYLGAWGPSVFQIFLFAGYTFLLGLFKQDHVPAVLQTVVSNVSKSVVVEPYLVTLTATPDVLPLFQHAGQEFIYLLEGEVTYRHADKLYEMLPGDSLFFDADVPHGPEVLTKLPIRLISVIIYPRGN